MLKLFGEKNCDDSPVTVKEALKLFNHIDEPESWRAGATKLLTRFCIEQNKAKNERRIILIVVSSILGLVLGTELNLV